MKETTRQTSKSWPTTLRFLSKRLKAMAGYSAAPATFDAMTFYLPPIASVTSRIVQMQDRKWELWSPNSVCHAYYPGVSALDTRLGTDLAPELRRSDGHLGRFDYSVTPQHYDDRRPWLGFMKKRRYDLAPENVFFSDVWRPTTLPNYGEFLPSFLDQISSLFELLLKRATELEAPLEGRPELVVRRPEYMTRNGTNSLRVTRTMDDAVDTFASVQRDVKELDAWNRMMEQLGLNLFETAEILTIPAADDSLIGVWMNGCTEANGNWLLLSKVPCFIVHEVNGDSDGQLALDDTNLYYSMSARTSLMTFENASRPFERSLQENGQMLDSKNDDVGIAPPGQIPRSMKCDRTRSSTKGQGWENGTYRNPRTLSASIIVDEPSEDQMNDQSLPPAVHAVIPNKPWTNWVEEIAENGDSCLVFQSKTNKYRDGWGEYSYYDRVNLRHLHLENPIDPPKNYDANRRVFGLPAPEFPFYLRNQAGDMVPQPQSFWVYEARDPLTGEAGREYVPSGANDTPPDLHDDDDVVSLGSEDDLHTGCFPRTVNPEEDNGMNVAGGPLLASETSTSRETGYVQDDHGRREREMDFTPSTSTARENGHRNNDNRKRFNNHWDSKTNDRREFRSGEKRERFRGRSPDRRWTRESRYPSYSPPRRRTRSRSSHYSPSPKRCRRRREDSSVTSLRHVGYLNPPQSLYQENRPSNIRYYEPSPSSMETRQRPSSTFDLEVKSQALIKRQDTEVVVHPTSNSSSNDYQTKVPEIPVAPVSLLHRLQNPADEHISKTENHSPMLRHGTDLVLRQLEDLQLPVASSSTALDLSHIDEQVIAMFPGAEVSPVATLEYRKQGDTRFLIVWNLPILYCWESVLKWAADVLKKCPEVKLLQILRTNEAGHQIFWFAVKNEAQGRSFRGHVNTRKEDSDQEVNCDFVSEPDYSSAAGRSIDRWDNTKGLTSLHKPETIFNEQPLKRIMSSSLAKRLGIPILPMSFTKRSRGKKAGAKAKAKMKRPTDGGAL